MIQIEEYVSEENANPFRAWFDDLDRQAAATVAIFLERLSEGNTSNVKPVGEGVSELKINRGPGYRVYFGWDSRVVVILLGGGTKRKQQTDIEAAHRRWRDYRKRKLSGD